MFDQDRSVGKVGSSKGMATARPSTGEPSGSPSFSGGSKSRLSLFAGGALSRTLSTPPIAESTHIGNCSFAWNGASPGGQSKRRPTSPLQNNRSLFKSSGNLSSIGRSSLQVYADAQSPGLVNRLVRYYDADQSTTMNRSQSLSSVYNKPGQFPLVHLRKQELRYGANNAARRRGSLSTIRIAAPERSFLQQSKRSSILRTGSMFLSGVNNESASDSLFGGRGGTVPGTSKTTASTTTTTTTTNNNNNNSAGNASDAENRVITPCAELEATPTRSVLDALKEISRKRINSEELDADRIKKQCKELSELDAAGSGPPSSTAAVAIGTHGMATKRSREQAGSPSSPSEGGVGLTLDRAGGGERQILKKRFCTKNNDILSSLSSSTLIVNTPKRVPLPRVERRFNMNQTPGAITPGTSMRYAMPTSSSTMLVGPTTPEKFSNMLLDSPSSTIRRKESSTSAGTKAPATTLPSTLMTTAGTAMAMMGGEQREQPTRPKITLFNRPYDATVKNTTTVVSSDGEEDEHGEGGGKVQFVKPKDKSPQLSGISSSTNSIGGTSSRDPLKKPSNSKLSVMLKCLNGDLDEDYEGEEDDEVEVVRESTPAKPAPASSQPRLEFTFNSTTKDTVDAAPAKEQNVAQPKQTETAKERPKETPAASTTGAAGTTPAATVTSSGISALINSPIKDSGLGTNSPASETTSEKQTEGEKRTEPTPVVSQVSEAPKPIVFSFGASSPAKTPSAVSSASFTSPTGGAPTGSTAPGIVAPTATFTFGASSVAAKKSDAPQTTTTTSANLISFSPAPAASGTPTFGSTFGAKSSSSPVVQFGSVATTPQSTTQSTASTGSTFTFAGGATASTTSTTSSTTTGSVAVTSPTFTFGGGSTFSAFKTPTAPVSSKTTGPASPPSSSGSLFAMPAPVSGAPGSTFTFGAKPASAVTTTTASTLPSSSVFGSVLGSGVPATTASTTTGGATTFTFGGAATAATTTAATGVSAPTTTFTFGAAATTTNPPTSTPASSSTTSTFPTFGASATTTAQPFVFGGPKASAAAASTTAPTTTTTTTTSSAPTTNLFAAAAAASSNSAATSNLFGGSTATGATGTNLFGGTASGTTSIFGAATSATQGASSTAPPASGGPTSSSSPFTFGAKPNSIAPLNGPSTNSATGGSIFGAAQQPSSANQPTAAPTPGGLFTFGSGTAGTGATPQVPAFGGSAATATAGTGSNSSPAPFTFGAAASKPTQGAPNAPATATGGGIFGSIAANNSSTNSGSNNNNNTGTVPAFGAGINGGATGGTFGGGAIFGSTATNTNPAAAAAGTGTSIFGSSNTQTTNGPSLQNTAGQSAPSGTGGLFTFGGGATTNNSSVTGGNTFGSSGTNATGGATATFGSLAANNATSGGLTNGIGGNKPFTFGASATAQPGQQQQQQAPAPAPVSGGFNFNLGSNAPNAAPKPFSFSAGNASTGNAVASPPMFGSPASNQPTAGSPFTFGASAANNNPINNNNTSNVASPGPFTFGQTQQPQQQQQGTQAFNFSAGNVATVAPQPQQQQQQPPAFNFGAGAPALSPFGAITSPGAPGAPAFGGAPTFAAPVGAGGMPTFSIGTNSTPNGPAAGQRRIKFATRRVK
ncbi:AGAP003983-PA-like protein [Anopheles sinensis]|uniref:AGAP003983-PA-like protein n=1 Tax=Anopheles sinensis TaxID=74873 RepID=A0A084W5A9_ANOSI|nr:AGAP003983-PA-like protein [Anopheles sinensis]